MRDLTEARRGIRGIYRQIRELIGVNLSFSSNTTYFAATLTSVLILLRAGLGKKGKNLEISP